MWPYPSECADLLIAETGLGSLSIWKGKGTFIGHTSCVEPLVTHSYSRISEVLVLWGLIQHIQHVPDTSF